MKAKKRFYLVLLSTLVLGAIVLAISAPNLPIFNRTARISWTDVTERTPEFLAIPKIEFCVVDQLKDPNMMGDGVALKRFYVLPGEKLDLDPRLQGLPPGRYNVYARAVEANGVPRGRWSAPQEVLIDITQPKAPEAPKKGGSI